MTRRPLFILLAICAGVVVILAATLLNARLRAAGSRLPERGHVTEAVPGCPGIVEIRLDRRGIGHISADNDRAMWFAQGYLHARDRFFQMELSRRVASGRLAELVGAAALESDRKMRTWRLTSTAMRQLVKLEGPERRVLEAYSAGVNAALDRYGRWISPEIWLLGQVPEPWRPEDSLRIGGLFNLQLSWAMGLEVERSVQLARLGVDRAIDLWGWSPEEARSWIPPGQPIATPIRSEEAIVPPIDIMGSNAWAIGPGRSKTGRALLANDPHLGVHIPGVWYASHLQCPGFHVAGLSIPGAPGVVIGHTDRVAWGLTNAMVDDQDLFVLTLNDAGDRELIDGNWQPLRTVTEEIRVRWQAEPVLVKIRISERGPVVREGAREALALSWTGLHGPSGVRAVLGMNRARSADEVAAAWEGVLGPAVDVIAADVDGHISMAVVGTVPRRGRGAGRLPAPGVDSQWAWRGFMPLSEWLAVDDPSSGFVAAANHDPFVEGDFQAAPAVPGEFDAPWRIRRIRSAITARDDWDVAGCLELQGDIVSGLALAALKQLWPDLEAHGGVTASRLLAWDGRMSAGAREPRDFARLMLRLGREIGDDEAFRDGLGHTPIDSTAILRLLAGGLDESWWDDVRTARSEDRQTILRRVLNGLDAERLDPVWGDVHQVEFSHPFVDFPLIGRLVGRSWSRGPFPMAGDSATVNASYWQTRAPFAVIAIPTARFVADVGNWDDSVLVLPPGQSGRPWSSHYEDQIRPWLELGRVSFPYSESAVEEETTARVTLIPLINDDE
jgi:penicillin G amidase